MGMIERPIMVIKERSRCICSALPYHYDTELMMVTLIKVVIRWLDAFPSKNSISNTLSPSMVVEGKNNPDMSLKRISFGSHTTVHTGTDNTMKQRE